MSQQKADNILKFIENYIATYHISPSVREIREGVGIASTSTIHRYLHRLEQEEKIHMTAGQNRTIVINNSESFKIPLRNPEHPDLFSEDNIIDYVSYVPRNIQKSLLFAIRATKDFPECGIHKNDILIAEHTSESEPGRPALFYDEDQKITVAVTAPSENILGFLASVIHDF